MEWIDVRDERFRPYGRVIEDFQFSALYEALEKTPITQEVVYVASCKELEALALKQGLEQIFFGEMPVQVGYCNGYNRRLNALEYHRSSEINAALNDTVLLLGKFQDISQEGTYDTGCVEAFKIPAGTAVELYATTLHYAPCHVGEEGFKVAVILPRGTNEALEAVHYSAGEERRLAAKNKWLLGHPQGGLPEGAYLGLTGENITL